MGIHGPSHLRKVEVICVILYYLLYLLILGDEDNVLSTFVQDADIALAKTIINWSAFWAP